MARMTIEELTESIRRDLNNKRTKEESLKLLVKAGILTKNGNLNKKYFSKATIDNFKKNNSAKLELQNKMELKTLPHKYKTTSQTIHSCQYHAVFCTRNNKKILTENVKNVLVDIITGCQEEFGFEIIEILINLNFINLVFFCDPHLAPAKIITKIKNKSASKLLDKFPEFKTKMQSIWTRHEFIATSGVIEMNSITDFLDAQKI